MVRDKDCLCSVVARVDQFDSVILSRSQDSLGPSSSIADLALLSVLLRVPFSPTPVFFLIGQRHLYLNPIPLPCPRFLVLCPQKYVQTPGNSKLWIHSM